MNGLSVWATNWTTLLTTTPLRLVQSVANGRNKLHNTCMELNAMVVLHILGMVERGGGFCPQKVGGMDGLCGLVRSVGLQSGPQNQPPPLNCWIKIVEVNVDVTDLQPI